MVYVRSIYCYSPMVVGYLLTYVIWANCHYTSDECDWIGSDLPHDPDAKSVKQIYLRCSKGHIEWDYAYGAIRITFQHGTNGHDFEGCIKPSPHFNGANVYLEGIKQLQFLIHPKQHKRKNNNHNHIDATDSRDSWKEQLSRTHCFDSRNGKATLFIEAMPNLDGKRKTVSFDYDLKLQKSSEESSTDVLEDCRPCNETELMTAFCASDFVVKSKIKELSNDQSNEETNIKISIGHIYTQVQDTFTENKQGRHSGTVVMPLRCGVKHGDGHFLMTGNKRLGKNRLKCAPRFSEFKKVAKLMTERGLNECDMSEVINAEDD
ncbi:meteorin-like protein [Glandiceps talaboti]